VRHLLAQAFDRGFASFQLWTHADNERAQRLYEGLGFQRSGREKDDDLGERTVQYVRPPAPTGTRAQVSIQESQLDQPSVVSVAARRDDVGKQQQVFD
jgi:hypothetical protein